MFHNQTHTISDKEITQDHADILVYKTPPKKQ